MSDKQILKGKTVVAASASDVLPDVTSGMTAQDLASEANRQHRLASEAAISVLMHAISAGEMLSAAKKIVPEGEWASWVEENFEGNMKTVQGYMRVAFYKDHLPVGEQTSLRDAYAYLKGLPPIQQNRSVHSDETRAEAVRLCKEGVRQKDVADLLGVSQATISNWLQSKQNRRRHEASYKKRKAEARRAKEAWRREERAKEVKAHGGTAAHAYAHLRKCVAAIDAAYRESNSTKEGQALLAALDLAYKAEDEIVRALGIGGDA